MNFKASIVFLFIFVLMGNAVYEENYGFKQKNVIPNKENTNKKNIDSSISKQNIKEDIKVESPIQNEDLNNSILDSSKNKDNINTKKILDPNNIILEDPNSIKKDSNPEEDSKKSVKEIIVPRYLDEDNVDDKYNWDLPEEHKSIKNILPKYSQENNVDDIDGSSVQNKNSKTNETN